VLSPFKTFGVAVYARPEGRPGGELQHVYRQAPSFHVIDHIFYHSDADTADLVPASGIEGSHPRLPEDHRWRKSDGDKGSGGECRGPRHAMRAQH
jgi:hypothetical protein